MKIVVGLTEHIGDIVACEPVTRYLKYRYPEASLDWVVLTPFREMIDTNPYIDNTIAVDCLTDWMKLSSHAVYDMVVDLHVNYRICQCCRIPLVKKSGNPFVNIYEWFDFGSILEAFSIGAGLAKLSGAPKVYIGEQQSGAVDALDLPQRYCVVHRVSNNPDKDWSDSHWRKLCAHLMKQGLAVIEVGAGREANGLGLAGAYRSLINRTTLLETAEVIRRATLFVGVDSAPAHFANAVTTPGVVLLGRLGFFKEYNPFTGFYAGHTSFVKLVRNLNGPASELEFAPVLEACNYVLRSLAAQPLAPTARASSRQVFAPIEGDHRERVLKSGLFDPKWYSLANPDVGGSGLGPLDHYLQIGAKELRSPGPDFDAAWYASINLDIAAAKVDPLIHFIEFGAAEGRLSRPPAPTSSHRRSHDDLRSERLVPRVSGPALLAPLASGLDDSGHHEADPVEFDEAASPLVLAFYLPQFHPIQENDWAHGMGFTEWTNVIKSKPLFRGHYQPRQPGELGYYDLRSPEVMRQQLALALRHGISGFCFYYYYFEGKKILYQPINQYIRSDATAPYCFLWANENWTKRWDGGDQEVIIQQNNSDHDDRMFIIDLVDTFRDERYIKVEGKPLLLVYKPHLFPDARKTTELWRQEIRQHGLPGLYLVMVDDWSQDGLHPREWGFDATYEIPSNIVHQEVMVDNPEDYELEPDFTGRLVDYHKFANFHASRPQPTYKRFRTVMLPWDNTPRYGNNAMVQVNTDTGALGTWLTQAYVDTYKRFPAGERIVFLHSWNEWCEGTYIEPDGKLGRKYLEEARVAIDSGRYLTRLLGSSGDHAPALIALQRLAAEKEIGAFRILQIARALSLHLRDEIESVRARRDHLGRELELHRDAVGPEREANERQTNELRIELGEYQLKAEKLRTELDEYGRNMDRLRSEVAEYRTSADNLRNEVEEYRLHTDNLQTELDDYRAHAGNLQSEWDMEAEHATELKKALDSARAHLDALQRSNSWRLTKPVRALTGLLRGPRDE